MIQIALDSPVPIHDQLVAGLRRLIATGAIGAGDELPPVRQLAADLGINLNTVARAYRVLTEAGLVMSARGRGTVVISATERAGARPAEERKRIEAALAAALADAKLAGFSADEAKAMVERQSGKLWKDARRN
jgi:GntR family transcriptional regulator